MKGLGFRHESKKKQIKNIQFDSWNLYDSYYNYNFISSMVLSD